MYKLKIVDSIATGKSVGCWLNEGEVEVTSAQFLAAELPCAVTVTTGGVTLGSKVAFSQMRQTVGAATVVSAEEYAAVYRQRRDTMLTETDYTQMADSPLTEASKAEFIAYRQALRDITDQAGWPSVVAWPQMPAVAKSAEG